MDESSKESKNCDKFSESLNVLKEKQSKDSSIGNLSTPTIKIRRSRSQSTSSDENLITTSTEDTKEGKRQKPETPQSPTPPTSPLAQSFGIGSLGGYGITPSPPKFVSLEEIMSAANGVENMVLAHEIAVDNNFRIEKVDPLDNSLEKTVEVMIHRAFWDILESQLNESPTNYKQSLVLLKEIKENVLSLLLPQHTRLQQEIEEILDLDLIRQQAENGILDFQRYAQYILSVCARLCAPIRDDKIRDLTQIREIVPLFKGIFELLDQMKLDMANFHIQQLRPHIQLKSIQYERQKFQQFLDNQSKLSSLDGLEYTKLWLKRNFESLDLENETNCKIITNKILINAYLELLVWDHNKQDSYPETLLLDATRINTIKAKVLKLTLIGSVFLVTYATVGPSIQGLQEFKDKLKEHLIVLISDKSSDYSEEELKSQMTSVSLQVKEEVKTCLEKHGFIPLDATKDQSLQTQIIDISCGDNRLRKVIERRILEFIERVVSSPTAAPMQIPTGLTAVKQELTQIGGQFVRIVAHNRAVFSQYYANIISDLIPGLSLIHI